MAGRTTFDVIVVGTGPGGATVARELTAHGAKVLLVERGTAAPPTGRAGQALRELWLPGRGMYRSGSVLVLRGVTLGGSSMYFFGTAWTPPHELLAPHGLDLRADADALGHELRPAPLPRELMGPRATALMDAAVALGHDWRPIPKFVDQDVLRRNGLGAFGAARWNARRFVDQAVAGGATLLTGTRAERVLVEGGAASGVELVRGRSRRVAHADTVVVAAGGLGSPVLLRASGIARAGREYFYDPVISITGTLPGLDAGFEPPMLAAAHAESDGYMLTDLCRPQWLHTALTVGAGRPDQAFGFRRQASVMVKARDELSGAMTRYGTPGKPLTSVDRSRLRCGEHEARAILDRAGAHSVYRTGYVAVHPGGTAKVGDVVDSDLQTEVRGLYVCDASVIPIEWGLPPTFTVMSLGRRLARRLSGAAAGTPAVLRAPVLSSPPIDPTG